MQQDNNHQKQMMWRGQTLKVTLSPSFLFFCLWKRDFSCSTTLLCYADLDGVGAGGYIGMGGEWKKPYKEGDFAVQQNKV